MTLQLAVTIAVAALALTLVLAPVFKLPIFVEYGLAIVGISAMAAAFNTADPQHSGTNAALAAFVGVVLVLGWWVRWWWCHQRKWPQPPRHSQPSTTTSRMHDDC